VPLLQPAVVHRPGVPPQLRLHQPPPQLRAVLALRRTLVAPLVALQALLALLLLR
jgi:hypothetical protein